MKEQDTAVSQQRLIKGRSRFLFLTQILRLRRVKKLNGSV
jgi:hypothetical protein